MIERVISHFCSLRLVRKKRLFAIFTELNYKSEEVLARSMDHFNQKSESFSCSSFLSLVDVRNFVRSTVWNILNIWILRKFYFARDFIVLRSFSRQKTLQKFIFAKTMEIQKRMSDSKYKHSIYVQYHLFNSIYRFAKKKLCSDTNEIQQTHCTQFD